jgi:hypothetical protein
VLGELEQVQSALDVHLMGGERRELGAGGEERGEVEDQFHLVLGEHALEQRTIENRPGDFAIDERRDGAVQPREVERHERMTAPGGQPFHEPVSDLATGTRDEDDRLPHHGIISDASGSSRPRPV